MMFSTKMFTSSSSLPSSMNFPGCTPAASIMCSVLRSPTPSAPVANAFGAASGILTFAFTSVTVSSASCATV